MTARKGFTYFLMAVCFSLTAASQRRNDSHVVTTVGGVAENISGSGPNAVAVSPGDWSQLAQLIQSQSPAFGEFGISVAISGNTVVIANVPAFATNNAVAFVFVMPEEGWRNMAPVAALSLPTSSNSGASAVAIDGDTIVLGAPDYFEGPGAAYVYVKPAGGWRSMGPTAILTPSDNTDDNFAFSVAIRGNTIVAGDTSASSSTGAAYVFVKPPGVWVNMNQTAKLTASDGKANDNFGSSVSIDGDTIAVGASQSSTAPGKAYVFTKPAAGWSDMTQTAELTVSGARNGRAIGYSISVSGGDVLVGAPDFSNIGPGEAYLFVKPSTGWTNTGPTATLTAADGQRQAEFGTAVQVGGRLAVVGARFRRNTISNTGGGVYVFNEPSSGWADASSSTVLTASDSRLGGWFGNSLGMSRRVLVVGAPTFQYRGAAYIFTLP